MATAAIVEAATAATATAVTEATAASAAAAASATSRAEARRRGAPAGETPRRRVAPPHTPTMPIERTEFSSGLRVVTERMPGVRSVSIGVWVLAGSRDERPRISGSSHFLEHLLFKGTQTRSAQDIAEHFDAVGGDVNAFTAREYTCYYARVLDRDLEMAVDHLADMVQHSVIRTADLDAERQVILEEINMHEDSPEDVVHDLYTETLWPEHPLGRPILGTVDDHRRGQPGVGASVLRPPLRAGQLRDRRGGQPAARRPGPTRCAGAWRPAAGSRSETPRCGTSERPVERRDRRGRIW